MNKKPVTYAESVEIAYNEQRWKLLKALRERALAIMKALSDARVDCVVHGSVARGDVSVLSDVDVFVPEPSSSFVIETALEKAGYAFLRRVLVQATPVYAVKAYVELAERVCVSFPLVKMRRVEQEFYRYGGELDLPKLENNARVGGVDKRLMLIEPTIQGHVESSVVGREDEVAGLLGVSVLTVLDRVRALRRRDKVGRTGVFVERELGADETFELVLRRLAVENPAVRRRLRVLE